MPHRTSPTSPRGKTRKPSTRSARTSTASARNAETGDAQLAVEPRPSGAIARGAHWLGAHWKLLGALALGAVAWRSPRLRPVVRGALTAYAPTAIRRVLDRRSAPA